MKAELTLSKSINDSNPKSSGRRNSTGFAVVSLFPCISIRAPHT